MFLSLLTSTKAAIAVWREERAEKKWAAALIKKHIATGPQSASLCEWKRAGNYLIAHMEVGKWWWWNKQHELWFFRLNPEGRYVGVTREIIAHSFDIWGVEHNGPLLEITVHELIASHWPDKWATLVFDTRENRIRYHFKTVL